MLDIIIPVYGGRDTLPQALDSLVTQTKKMFIVTIVQDCDDEDYTDIIGEYTRRGLNIKLITTPENVGPGLARQFGMDQEKMCDYCIFVDADDLLNPRAVEILYTEAKKQNADIVLSDFYAERHGEPGSYLSCKTTPVTWCHGKCYKLQYLREKNIRFLPELRLNEDSYFNLVAVSCAERKFYVNECTYIWRANPTSLTRKAGELNFFLKSWEQYVASQVYAIENISKISGSMKVESLALALNNIYSHCMKALYCNLDIDLPIIHQLTNSITVKNGINNEKFWKVIDQNLKASCMFNKQLIFYRMRFCDWLRKYVLGENK